MEKKRWFGTRRCLTLTLVFCAPVLAQKAQITGRVADTSEAVVPGAKALSTISSKARFPDFFDPDPHVEGLVYAGANADLLKQLGPEAFTELLIAALPFQPESPEEIRLPRGLHRRGCRSPTSTTVRTRR